MLSCCYLVGEQCYQLLRPGHTDRMLQIIKYLSAKSSRSEVLLSIAVGWKCTLPESTCKEKNVGLCSIRKSNVWSWGFGSCTIGNEDQHSDCDHSQRVCHFCAVIRLSG
jgi:hypothetical protein